MPIIELKSRPKKIIELTKANIELAGKYASDNGAVGSITVVLLEDRFKVFISETDSRLRLIGALSAAMHDLLHEGSD